VTVLQPFAVAAATLDGYRRYVRSSFPLRDVRLDSQREALVDAGLLWADAYVALARPGRTGPKLAAMDDFLLPETLGLPWGFDTIYAHQETAIRRLAVPPPGLPQNTLVLSGTGSGKTESFLIPIIDACLRNPSPGVRAIVIYPMNALANDQLGRLRQLLGVTPAVTFGRYTGDTPEVDGGDERRPARPTDVPPNLLWSRRAMRETPPNILLTNYVQLENLLLRRKDHELFRFGPPTYLVVDEIHLFTGVLGAEVANLIRRFREHVGAGPRDMCMVGTSATAGEGELDRLQTFAARFFGSPFDADAAVSETPASPREVGDRVPPSPTLTRADLEAAIDVEGVVRLARLTLGLDLSPDETFPSALGRDIDRFRTIGVVEEALASPAAVEKAATALGRLTERADASPEALRLEAMALVLLGAAARVAAVGEEAEQPRFRPRVHQVARSLVGLARCLGEDCQRLLEPGVGRCPNCLSRTLPLSTCRTCGEAYWSSLVASERLAEIKVLAGIEPRPGSPAAFLWAVREAEEVIDEDEAGSRVDWERVRICAGCGAFASDGDLDHDRACPTPLNPGRLMLASTDRVHCPNCGDTGARNRPIILPLRGSAAASVAVLTQTLSDELRQREGQAGGRLLVFADSRQDAAQQAGYADDQGARVAVRQLIRRAVGESPQDLPNCSRAVQAAVSDDRPTLVRWLIGESERSFAEVADPDYQPSEADEQGIRRQLDWEVALEFTERSRRRFSLEQEGLVVVGIDRLDELVDRLETSWPDHPFGDRSRFADVVRAWVDVWRYTRAVDHWMLQRTPKQLVQAHSLRIGDRAVVATRGYGPVRVRNNFEQIDIRGWTAPQNATRMTELMGRILGVPPTHANGAVEALASRLHAVGLLSESRIGTVKRQMVDASRIVLRERDAADPLWRCDRCGLVRGAQISALNGRTVCVNWHCDGTPRLYEPAVERDFYRRQYLAEPRRLLLREHSGQIEGDERLALEERFNDREHPTIDALACTPTLEVGVSIDDLHAVILRNLPPTPANYAQRVGRAGRRSKVALAVAHAGSGPHDAYFYDRPQELIAGLVRAPTMSLDNAPLLRRHVNSLIFELLGLDLPTRWVPPLDIEEVESLETIADSDGVLRESTLLSFETKLADPAVRAGVEGAVRGAFANPDDPAPPVEAEAVALGQLEAFSGDLRAALNRWCDRYRALMDELNRSRRARGVRTRTERELEARLEDELRRMADPKTPESQPLGFLGLVGFLPRYGFTGTSVLLHVPRSQIPITQTAHVAVAAFAPANVVYARGRRLKVRRLDPAPVLERDTGPEHRDNVLRTGRRCDSCEILSFDPLLRACPTCGSDLISQDAVELTGVRASGGQISSEDEYRTREQYDVGYLLSPVDGHSGQMTLGGFLLERTSGREITVVNRGLEPEDPDVHAAGFTVCLGCGVAAETSADGADDDTVEDLAEGEHAPRCPGRRDAGAEIVRPRLWLSARIRGDVLELELPEAARDEGYARWRTTLAEALKLGIRATMDAGQRDLDSFIRLRGGRPHSIVIFDTMPGGTGYIPKLFADDGRGMKAAAADALRRLDACDCDASCHKCLRDFWNQRVHGLLDRFEVLTALARMAEGEALIALDPVNTKLESFLETEFFERMRAAGLPLPTLQVVRELGSNRVIRVDAEYRTPDISIFLDGRAYHAGSEAKILDDLEIRNRLEARDVLVLEFPFHEVLDRFDNVASVITKARTRHAVAERRSPYSAGALEIAEVDERSGVLRLTVDPAQWVRDRAAWESALATSNALRLDGWRLRRIAR
jgi:replicative superfamily II helicase